MSTEYTPIVVPMKVNGGKKIKLSTKPNTVAFDLGVDTNIIVDPSHIPTYEGAYDVTPLPRTEVILGTANRRMENDVTVREIPYSETTNESGGYTVIIG